MNRRKKQKLATKPSPVVKPISAHLAELRTRLGIVFAFFIIAGSLAYAAREPIVQFILAPLGTQEKLVYLTPGGGFTFIFQIAIYTGLLATAPLAIYQLYRFVSPALSISSRRGSFWLILSATALMLGGVAFGYYLAIPGALHFLTNFANGLIVSNLTADSYLNFVAAYLLGLGLMFQLPLILLLWNHIFPMKPGGLMRTQRFVILGSFIAAALITPTPDVVNQCLIALPIIAVYQLGVVAVWVINRRETTPAAVAVLPQEQSVPPSQAQSKYTQSTPQEILTHIANQRLPAPRPAPQTIAKPQARARTVDGFASRPRTSQATRLLNKTSQQPSQPLRSRRSIDGIM